MKGEDRAMTRPRLMLVGEITIKPAAGSHWSDVVIRPANLHALVVEERGGLTYWVPELPPLPIEITFQAAGGRETKVLIENAKPKGGSKKGHQAIRRDVTLISGRPS